MKIIENWETKNLKCMVCGSTKSVKYESINKYPMCNKCITIYDDVEPCDFTNGHIKFRNRK